MLREKKKLVPRPEEEPRFSIKNKGDRLIIIFVLVLLAILAVVLAALILIYYFVL